MGIEIKYGEFFKTYPKKYKSASFYPKFLKLRNEGFNGSEIREKLKDKIPKSTIRSWYNGTIPFPFKEFSRIKKKFDENDLKKLAIIVGHVFGDGGISKRKFLHYCNTEKFLINEFQSTMKSLFGFDPMYKKKEKTGIVRLRYPKLVSRILLCLFGEFSLGRDSKKITQKIQKMPIWWKKIMIRAWYNDDGSVPNQKNYKVISFKQKNKELVIFIKNTLARLKINSHITGDDGKWMLRIMSYRDMVRFKELIGFSDNYRKQNELKKVLSSLNFPHWETKIKMLELLKERPRTVNELAKKLNLETGTIHGHLIGWKRSESSGRKSTTGLKDMDLVKIKRTGRKYIYLLNEGKYEKLKDKLNLEEVFKEH